MIYDSAATSEPIMYNEVYYVDPGNSGQILNPIAIRPRVGGNLIWWNDTSRGSSYRIASLKTTPPSKKSDSNAPEKIEIKTVNGIEIVLKKLDLKTYYEKVKNRVIGKPDFDTDQQLRDFYLTSSFELNSNQPT